jgi:biotin carboxylase
MTRFVDQREPSSTSARDPRILVIPGGEYQLPLVREARSRGHYVICADRNSECPCARQADLFFPIGVDDSSALLAMAHEVRPAAIVTDQTDAAVSAVAWLNERLGLRGIGAPCAELFTHKHRMRSFSTMHGFPSPPFECCTTEAEALQAASRITYPVVVKPVDGQSSKGVHRAHDAESMKSRFGDALAHSNSATVIVEAFLDGPEYTLEGFMTAQGHRTLAISKKSHYTTAPMVASALEYMPPTQWPQFTALVDQHDRWINESALPFGMTHAEYKHVGGVFQMIEVAARGGGSRISSDIVPWISQANYQGLLLDAALGVGTGSLTVPDSTRSALLEFFTCPSGELLFVHGLDAARRVPGVVDVVFKAEAGAQLTAPQDDAARPGYLILRTDTPAELAHLRDHVHSLISIGVR